MATDIKDISAASSVKIIGSSSTGVESTPLGVDSNGAAKAALRDLDTNRASGSIASAGGSVALAYTACSIVMADVRGAWIGTLVFEGSLDGGVTFPVTLSIFPAPTGAPVTSTTTNGAWIIPAGGYSAIRVRASAFTSGTANIILNGTIGTNSNAATNTANQGLPNLDSNAWPSRIVDLAQNSASITSFSRLRVNIEPSTLLADNFDTGAIDPIMWSTAGVGTASVSTATGNLTISTGTTLSNAAWLSSNATFQHPGNAYLQFGAAIRLEPTAILTNTKRYWGFATGGGTFASPLTDGVVFEVDETGTLRASIYNSGTRTFSQVVTAPLDGLFHRYDIFYNTQHLSFFVDNSIAPVAKITTGLNPSVQTLPGRIAMFNSPTTAPTSAPTLQCQAIAFTDTASNNKTISDGKYGWRKVNVDSQGSLQVSNYSPTLGTYATGIYVRLSGGLSTNSVIWAMRNSATAAKSVYIERIYLTGLFDAGTPLIRSLLRLDLRKFSGATPSTGTIQVAASMDPSNPASSVTDIRSNDGGLNVNGITFNQIIASLAIPSSDGVEVNFHRQNIGIRLAPGEGICLRAGSAGIAGHGVSGEISWSER